MYRLLLHIIFLSGASLPVWNGSLSAQCPGVDTAGIADWYSLTRAPVYPGGEAEMLRFLLKTQLPSPDAIQGPVFTLVFQFVIEADGSVSNICALRHPDHPWAQAYIRRIAEMPRFSPGEQDGRPVRCRYTLPLRIHPE
ncbi:MAG: hypothetical protein IT259_02880 [Saprospiraceae bacterium]|nr:hypothetical protein [Saprospiraceae bacterium]